MVTSLWRAIANRHDVVIWLLLLVVLLISSHYCVEANFGEGSTSVERYISQQQFVRIFLIDDIGFSIVPEKLHIPSVVTAVVLAGTLAMAWLQFAGFSNTLVKALVKENEQTALLSLTDSGSGPFVKTVLATSVVWALLILTPTINYWLG